MPQHEWCGYVGPTVGCDCGRQVSKFHSGRCILLGDSAHAVTSTLGQVLLLITTCARMFNTGPGWNLLDLSFCLAK